MDATTKPTTAQQQIPLNSDIYFCPNPVTDEKFSKHYWVGSAIDQYRFDSGLVFSNEADAITACNIMLAPADTTPDNAHLIAAAPDLLEALEALTNLHWDWVAGSAYVPVAFAAKNKEAIAKARAAIAKAAGEQK